MTVERLQAAEEQLQRDVEKNLLNIRKAAALITQENDDSLAPYRVLSTLLYIAGWSLTLGLKLFGQDFSADE